MRLKRIDAKFHEPFISLSEANEIYLSSATTSARSVFPFSKERLCEMYLMALETIASACLTSSRHKRPVESSSLSVVRSPNVSLSTRITHLLLSGFGSTRSARSRSAALTAFDSPNSPVNDFLTCSTNGADNLRRSPFPSPSSPYARRSKKHDAFAGSLLMISGTEDMIGITQSNARSIAPRVVCPIVLSRKSGLTFC